MLDFALGGNGRWLEPQMQIVAGMSERDMHVVFDSNSPEGIRGRILETMDRSGGYATFAYHPVVVGNYPREPFGSCILTKPSVRPSSLKSANALEFLITLQRAYKGRHVGSALIAHSLGVAARHNVDVIFGAVDFANTGMDSFCRKIRAIDGAHIRYAPDMRMGTNVIIIPTDEEVREQFKEKLKGTIYRHK